MKFNYERAFDNLYITFGTRKLPLGVKYSVLKILIPWIKELPLNGLEWSVQYEENCMKELENKAEQFTIKIDTTEVREEKDEKRPFY